MIDNKLKIILVVSDDDLNSQRGTPMVESFIRLENMFPEFEKYQKNIGLVITKGKRSITNKNYISLLSKDPPQRINHWIYFFKHHPENVFVFPEPSEKNVGSQYDFNDRKRLLNFLCKDFIINPKHVVALSETARLQMEQVRINHLNNVFAHVQDLCEKINMQFQENLTVKEITKWLDILRELMNRDVKTSKELAIVIHEMIPNGHQYNEYFKKMEEFELFDSFIDATLHPIDKTSCLNEIIRAWCHKCVIELLKEQKIAFKLESQQKEIKKQKEQKEKIEKINQEFKIKLQEVENMIKQKEIELQKRYEEESRRVMAEHEKEKRRIEREIYQNEIRKQNSYDQEQQAYYESMINNYKERCDRLEEEKQQITLQNQEQLEDYSRRIEYLEKELNKGIFRKIINGIKYLFNGGKKFLQKIFH